MTPRKTLALVLLASATVGTWPRLEAAPEVLRGKDFAQRITSIHSVAVVPIDCPGTLDCASSERELVYFLRVKRKLRVADSSQLAQLLFEQGLTASDLTKDAGVPLLTKLGVDALVQAKILDYHRVDHYLGGGPGIELRAELEVVVPGAPPLAKGSDTDGGPDMQFAGKPPLARILNRVAEAIFSAY